MYRESLARVSRARVELRVTRVLRKPRLETKTTRREMIGSLLLSDALTSKFFSVLFLGKLHVFLMRMCFPSEGCWDLGEVSRSKPK